MERQGYKLYEELGELARFVETAMRTISEASPEIISSTSQLPAASSHLRDLTKMTEDGTLEVMRLTEIIQDNRDRTAKELSAMLEILRAIDCQKLVERLEKINEGMTEDANHLMEIMTALSFQDLVAQRVKKLASILDEVQNKLMHLVVVFGLQQDHERLDEAVDAGMAGELLKQLEESKTTSMKQKVADDLLAQFGFK